MGFPQNKSPTVRGLDELGPLILGSFRLFSGLGGPKERQVIKQVLEHCGLGLRIRSQSP